MFFPQTADSLQCFFKSVFEINEELCFLGFHTKVIATKKQNKVNRRAFQIYPRMLKEMAVSQMS